MIIVSLIICAGALTGSFFAARKSEVAGLCVLLAVGYVFGITRANLPNAATYFLFDLSVAGLYAGVWMRPLTPAQRYRIRGLLPWIMCLVGWPLLLFFIPVQNPFVQLLGLRTAVFFLPFILIGAMMDGRQFYRLALWIAVLDLVVFAFAILEFIIGLEPFYPHNAVTTLIYSWKMFYLEGKYADLPVRIPATFVASAQFGMTMVLGIPLLWGALVQRHERVWQGWLLMAAIAAAAIGTLISASRTQTVIMICTLVFALISGRVRLKFITVWMLIAAVSVVAATQSPRLQRVMTLQDQGFVGSRLEMSMNERMFELAREYPLGNGLGGGGTSVPYFLSHETPKFEPLENEYSRIMLEEGLPGLLLWLAFLGWVFLGSPARASDPWRTGRRLAWFVCGLYFLTAGIGIGLFISIPGAVLLFMLVGWIAAPQPIGYRVRAPFGAAARHVAASRVMLLTKNMSVSG